MLKIRKTEPISAPAIFSPYFLILIFLQIIASASIANAPAFVSGRLQQPRKHKGKR